MKDISRDAKYIPCPIVLERVLPLFFLSCSSSINNHAYHHEVDQRKTIKLIEYKCSAKESEKEKVNKSLSGIMSF